MLTALLTFDDSVLVLGLGLGEVSAVLVSAAVLVGEGLGRDLLLVVGGGGGVVRSGGISRGGGVGGGGGVGCHGHGGGGQGAGDKQGGDKRLRWSHYIVLLLLVTLPHCSCRRCGVGGHIVHLLSTLTLLHMG